MQKNMQNKDWRANFSLVGTRHDSGSGKDRLSIYKFFLYHNEDKVRAMGNGFASPADKILEREISDQKLYSQFSDALRLRHYYSKIARFPFRFSDGGKIAISRNHPPYENHEGYVLAGLAEYLALGDLLSLGAQRVQFLDGSIFRTVDVANALRFGLPRTEFSGKSLPEGLLIR